MWITNLPAPYRFPVWNELSRVVDLEVILLSASASTRRWSVPADAPYVVTGRTPAQQLAHSLRARGVILVVGGWERPTYLLAMLLAKARRVPTVLFYESTSRSHRFTRGIVGHFRSGLFRSCDAVLTVGVASTDAVLSFGVPPARIVTGFNTVDVARFREKTAQIRDSRLTPPGHRLLYVGQLIGRKNVSSALRAWAQVRRGGDTFVVVGQGPEKQNLRRLAADLAVGGSVVFAGYLQGADLLEQFAAAQTFILPSVSEVWGLVVNEALAAGLHVVVSREAGVARSVDGMPGVFVSASDPTSLAAAIEASRRAWEGPIPDPPILDQNPARLAHAALSAMKIAMDRHPS